VPTVGGRKVAQADKDGQRNTMHNTLRYTKQCETVHSKALQLHKSKNRLSNRTTYLVNIKIANSPTHTLFDIISHGVNAVPRHAQDIDM